MARKHGKSSPKVEKVEAKVKKTVEVPVHYEKANHFRVIHVDGVIGNVLPSGRGLSVALYSERIPFPKSDVYDIGPDGNMILPREGAGERKKGFFREIEISAVMDWETAKSLADWLAQAWPVLQRIADRRKEIHGSGADTTAASKLHASGGEKKDKQASADEFLDGFIKRRKRRITTR